MVFFKRLSKVMLNCTFCTCFPINLKIKRREEDAKEEQNARLVTLEY